MPFNGRRMKMDANGLGWFGGFFFDLIQCHSSKGLRFYLNRFGFTNSNLLGFGFLYIDKKNKNK